MISPKRKRRLTPGHVATALIQLQEGKGYSNFSASQELGISEFEWRRWKLQTGVGHGQARNTAMATMFSRFLTLCEVFGVEPNQLAEILTATLEATEPDPDHQDYSPDHQSSPDWRPE